MNVVVISDTHSRERKIEWFKNKENINKVNTVIHCGDFSHSEKTFWSFLKWYSELEIDNKILIAGNHDEYVRDIGYEKMKEICSAYHVNYLQDSGIEIDGIKFWGSPMSNEYGSWAFMANDFELDQYWQKIPLDTNVLITHGPAYGVGDYVFQDNIQDNHVGSRTLEIRIRELKNLKYHFVGHIHDSKNKIYQNEHFITYNACIMDFFFKPTGQPHVFEIKK